MEPVGYFYEVSELDPKSKNFTLRTRNLSLPHVVAVEERCIFTEHPEHKGSTLLQQEAKVAAFGITFDAFRTKAEEFCMFRFQSNSHKGRMALESVINTILMEPRGGIADVLTQLKPISASDHV